MATNNIYTYAQCGNKKEAVKSYISHNYPFTYEDIIAFLNYFTGRETTEAIKRGLVNISGIIKTSKKVYYIIGFLTVEIYKKQIRFDDRPTYNNLNVDAVMEDVEKYIIEQVGGEGQWM